MLEITNGMNLEICKFTIYIGNSFTTKVQKSRIRYLFLIFAAMKKTKIRT